MVDGANTGIKHQSAANNKSFNDQNQTKVSSFSYLCFVDKLLFVIS